MDKYYLQYSQHSLICIDGDEEIELQDLNLNPELVEELTGFGIIEANCTRIPGYKVLQIEKLLRIVNDLDINVQAAAIILDLLEKVESLKDENTYLKNR